MYDFMLGPLGEQYWAGPDVLPRARLHMDWSRVAFPVAAQIDPLHAFSFGIGDQQPAAITAAIGATQADALDTSISAKDALSKTCLLSHLGVSIDRMNYNEGADVAPTLAEVQVALPRILLKIYHAERSNEESRGLIEDYPEGIGVQITDFTNATAYGTHCNGINMMSSIRALPRPLPTKGGETYFRVSFCPSARDGGVTHVAVVTSYTVRAYGIAPAKVQPSEAPGKALKALGELQAAYQE